MFVSQLKQQACNRCCRQRLLHKDELHLFFLNKCLHTCNGVNTREAKLRTKQKNHTIPTLLEFSGFQFLKVKCIYTCKNICGR